MANRVVKVTFFATLVALILWVIARVRSEMEPDPFNTEG